MAVTTADLKRMQRDIETLKKKVAQLERRKNGEAKPAGRKSSSARTGLSERERVREILRRGGVTREMTTEEKRVAEQWTALSETEKRKVTETLRRVRIDPPLSQLIHEMRG